MGLGTIGLASAGAGLGTTAYFSDEESFEDNQLTAGELDLRIDWQQTYDGPAGDGAPYGNGGPPYVNAHPDHDNDGIQSLDTSNYDSVPDNGVVTYEDEGANIQEYLTCETLSNFEVPDDFDNGNRQQESLIELDDVKPGDSGEVTFSFHLCDNPGYVWFQGGNFAESENGRTEPEMDVDETADDAELAENIIVRAWYDLDCDNDYEPEYGEDIIVDSPTTLKTFFQERLTEKGRLLNPAVYDGGTASDSNDGDSEDCPKLGKLEWGSDGLVLETGDDNVDGELLQKETDPLSYVFRIENTVTGVQVLVKIFELQMDSGDDSSVVADENVNINEVEEFDWEIVDKLTVGGTTYESDDVGMCELKIKSGTSTDSFDLFAAGCTTGQTNVVSPGRNSGGEIQGISFTEFHYCPPGRLDDPPLCFEAGETFCVGFEWWLPSDVGNEIQTDTASFDLGFYTEQCRHNNDPGQTMTPESTDC